MNRIQLKSDEQIRKMRTAGLVVSEALNRMIAEAKSGMTTRDLDAICRDVLKKHNATSNFLNYGADFGITPYPGVVCTSVNEVVVHGIPSERQLKAGDLISVDFGAIVDGWHGDAARSFVLGDSADLKRDAQRSRMAEISREAMWAGIAQVRRGNRIGDISHAVEKYIHSQGDFGILREYTGHGIGTAMHMRPDVPNYGRPRRGPKIVAGMCICIEPMITAGTEDTVTYDDDWTVVTADGSDAAHWENTVALTSKGVWVLTEPDGGRQRLNQMGIPYGGLD